VYDVWHSQGAKNIDEVHEVYVRCGFRPKDANFFGLNFLEKGPDTVDQVRNGLRHTPVVKQ
jgi:hypothetical protein